MTVMSEVYTAKKTSMLVLSPKDGGSIGIYLQVHKALNPEDWHRQKHWLNKKKK
jgi:hypothetical protein